MFGETAFSGYSVRDQEEARQFYEDVMGLMVDDTSMGLTITFENGHSVFLYPKDDHEPATFTVLNFVVEDINEAMKRLAERGVEFEHYDDLPADQDENEILRGKAAGYGPDIAWFKDPSDNTLAIVEQ